MAKNIREFARNVKLSFRYAKNDLIKANESINELYDKIQHISLNQATLLGEVESLKRLLINKKKMAVVNKKSKKKKKSKRTSIEAGEVTYL